jgi:hypothetical protein
MKLLGNFLPDLILLVKFFFGFEQRKAHEKVVLREQLAKLV